jgi:hypothetical protein
MLAEDIVVYRLYSLDRLSIALATVPYNPHDFRSIWCWAETVDANSMETVKAQIILGCAIVGLACYSFENPCGRRRTAGGGTVL